MTVEYDDGKDPKGKDKPELFTRRGRPKGFYVVLPDETSLPIPIGYMRISEMKALEKLFRQVRSHMKRLESQLPTTG